LLGFRFQADDVSRLEHDESLLAVVSTETVDVRRPSLFRMLDTVERGSVAAPVARM
jgi:hypothetical protein